MGFRAKAQTPLRIEESARPDEPFFREAGAGPGVVCLHASASTSSQWRPLMESFASRYHVLAADLLGAGNSPACPAGSPFTLHDEVALLEPVFARAGDPHVLVAHSYGAAVALAAAVAHPHRVRALALYEPTLFALLDAESPPPNDADCFRRALDEAAASLDADDPNGAAQRFVDYWAGNGAWVRTPEARKQAIVASITNLRQWAFAVLNDSTPLAAFSGLDIPVLYMMGRDSPVSSRSLGRLLTRVLPRVQLVEYDGIGHMGPITHATVVNATIMRFLERC
jgi:pimeloyl-ACP methyl ester carboxylesterase